LKQLFHRRVAIGTLRIQISAQKIHVAEFVVGVVRDVLRHVSIELFERVDVGGSAVDRERQVDFRAAELNGAEFGVLLPEIAFNRFQGEQEAENGGVAAAKAARRLILGRERSIGGSEHADAHCSGAGRCCPLLQKGAPAGFRVGTIS
jgi:hypothetical protein